MTGAKPSKDLGEVRTLSDPPAAGRNVSVKHLRLRGLSLEWPALLLRRPGRTGVYLVDALPGQAPLRLPSVSMLSALLRAAFSVSAFLRAELCWSRARQGN
jgi:hypothetical protein